MTGLRARQKADRHQRILQAASELFRKSGYEGAKIEAIAALAEVSIGTIYNYYQNKGDLLVAIVAMEVNEVLNAGQGVIAKPPADVMKAVDRLVIGYIEHSLVYLSKEMWRQAMAISTQQPDSPFGKTYGDLDRALTDQTCALIARLQELGLVRRDIDSRSVGEMIFNNTNMMFIVFVKDETMTIAELRAAIRRLDSIVVESRALEQSLLDADDHRQIERLDELLQVERLTRLRNVLGGHDRAPDDEDVELGGKHIAAELLHALRRERCRGDDAARLDLTDPLLDKLGLDRLGVDVLDDLGGVGCGRFRDPLVHGFWVRVPGPESFEVQDGEASELADLDRRLG